MLRQPSEIRAASSQTQTAEQYIDTRFTSAWGSVVHDAQVKLLNDVIRTHQAKTVLEIAPGPARLSCEVSGFERGFLCEFNESMIAVAQHRLRLAKSAWRLIRGDAFNLPLHRGLFDLVYSFRFIRHFEAGHREALYSQIRHVLTNSGLLVFDAVNVDVGLPARLKEGLDRSPIYDEFYKLEKLKTELVEHGFTPIAVKEVIRHLDLQQQVQVLIGPRSKMLARWMIQALEYVPGQPLEWIVVARKTA